MPAIGHVQRQSDGSFKGQIRTLSVSADIAIVPNRGKQGDQPDYRILSNGVELGGGWIRTGEVSNREYVPNCAAVSAALRSTPPPTKSAPPSPAARPLRGP